MLSSLVLSSEYSDFVRIRHYPEAHLIAALTNDGRLLMLDSWTFVEVKDTVVCSAEMNAKDFVLLGMDDENSRIDDTKIVLLVHKAGNYEVSH